MISIRQLFDLYDDWNIPVVVNDRNLNKIERFDHVHEFVDRIKSDPKLYEHTEVMSFGHYDGELTLRINADGI